MIEGPQHPDADIFVPEDAKLEDAQAAWMKEILQARIDHHNGHLEDAARSLGISAETLRRHRIKYGLKDARKAAPRTRSPRGGSR